MAITIGLSKLGLTKQARSNYTAEATALFAAMSGTLTAVKLLTIGCIL